MDAMGERNFHCLHQLVEGASAAERAKWSLRAAGAGASYGYLSSQDATIPGVNDWEDDHSTVPWLSAIHRMLHSLPTMSHVSLGFALRRAVAPEAGGAGPRRPRRRPPGPRRRGGRGRVGEGDEAPSAWVTAEVLSVILEHALEVGKEKQRLVEYPLHGLCKKSKITAAMLVVLLER